MTKKFNVLKDIEEAEKSASYEIPKRNEHCAKRNQASAV